MRDPAIEARARRYYADDLPYHNFAHALEVVENGAAIVERCRIENLRVDPTVVYFALLFHDAGYRDDHAALGYDCKEAYAADIAHRELRAAGYDARTTGRVGSAIMSTRHHAGFYNNEQRAVRAADLAGLAADYATFRGNAERLRQEALLLEGREYDWCSWVQRVCVHLSGYLNQHIRLTRFYYDPAGQSAFHARLHANLERLRNECA